jgi:beta-galactosidase GanA
VYKRGKGENELLVYFNVENHTSEFELPIKGKYQDLLTGQLIDGKKFKMESLSAMILKKIK